MAQSPTNRQLHVDAMLTNISIAYQNPVYIAERLVPNLPVSRQSGIIPKYDQSYWFRDAAELRAPGTRSRRGGFKVDVTSTYFCPRYSYGFELPDEVLDNQDDPFNLERDATEFVTDRIALRKEILVATTWFTTGVWGTPDAVGTTDFVKWGDYANSDPLVIIERYMNTVEGRIAREPNALVMGKGPWSTLKWHPDLMETIKYTERAIVSEQIFQALIGIPNFFVGRGIFTDSPEGTAEASVVYQRIWGNNALLLYRPQAPSLMTPSAAYTVVWNRVTNASSYIRRLREESEERDVIEGNAYFQPVQTARNAGQFLSAVI